ncbi:MAG: FecR domain-containing protein [Bacillota bacterium]
MSHLGKTEKSIFTIALIMLIAFSYFLYDDSLLFPKVQNDKLELIGSVAVSQKDVRRKNLDTFSWLPASTQDKVYLNDSIFTGDGSEAQIKLQDGTVIRIQPNSLITLNMKNGQMMLDLRYGNLVGELTQGSNLTIKSGTEEFKLDASTSPEKSKIQFKKSHSGNVDLKLLAGKVNYVDTKKQAQKELLKDKEIAVTPKGEIKPIQKPTIELKTPANISWVRVNPDDPLTFEWIGHGDISRYEIEIAPSNDFVSLAASKVTPEMNAIMTDPLAPGAYFWRVKVYDLTGAVGAVSEFRPMSITHLGPPQITAPQKSAEFNYELRVKSSEDLAASTDLQWQANPILKNFKWQVSTDPQFSSVIKEGVTTANSATTPKLPSGTYWVRVAGETAEQKSSPWSEAVPFTLNLVAQKEPERPSRPILVTKEISFKLPLENERRPASEMAPQVEWKPVMDTNLYRVQVSKDMSFKEVESYDAKDTKTLLSQITQPGNYYFRVFARGTNGLTSPSSDIGTLTVELSPRPVTLTIPKLMEPFNNASIFLQTAQEPFIWLEWKKVAGAAIYKLEISDTEDFSHTLVSTTLEKNRFLIKNRVPLGKIYWRVRAEKKDASEVSEWAEKREFTIYHQKNETFVK